MSRITDSKVSGQYIPSLSLSLYEKRKKKMWALERRQNKASSHLVLFRAATAVRAARRRRRRRHSRHVRQGQHRRKRKRLLLLERLCPSRNRRFKRGIGKKYSAPFLCACACIFSSKKDAKIREQRTKQTLLLASTLTKQSAVVHTTTRLVRKRDHLHSPTSIHPSIGRRRTTTTTGSKRRPPSPV